MDLQEAILTRRTIKDFRAGTIAADLLDQVLTAGIWAQNHRLTQPWRFIVLGPESHQRLAEIAGEAQLTQLSPGAPAAEREKVRQDAVRKISAKPLIVGVAQHLGGPGQRQEDYGAIACAIQNIQLAAWSEGIGMQWSSGKLLQLPQTYALLGLRPDEDEVVALLYFGYPATVPPPQPRKPLAEVTRRLP